MKKLAWLALLLATCAQAQTSRGPVACYLYDASGNPLSSTGGALNISGGAGGGGNAAAGLTGSAVPTSAGYTGFNSGGNMVGVSSGNPLPVTVSNFPATQAVTGTFWQATQPVSGTFWQATQPVSGTVTANQGGTWTVQPGNTANTTPWSANITQFGGSAVATGTGAGGVGVPRVTVSNDSTVGIVNAAAVAKGTQGANGVPTQDLKDSGRSARTITLDGFAIAATTETLHTMSYSTDNGTLTTGTSYSVTSGKRLRVQQIVGTLHTIAGNTTAITCIIRIRANAAGAAIVTSPVQYVMALPGVAAANQSAGPVVTQFPDGWEFAASTGIGVTSICPGFVTTTAAPKLNITITGYEY